MLELGPPPLLLPPLPAPKLRELPSPPTGAASRWRLEALLVGSITATVRREAGMGIARIGGEPRTAAGRPSAVAADSALAAADRNRVLMALPALARRCGTTAIDDAGAAPLLSRRCCDGDTSCTLPPEMMERRRAEAVAAPSGVGAGRGAAACLFVSSSPSRTVESVRTLPSPRLASPSLDMMRRCSVEAATVSSYEI